MSLTAQHYTRHDALRYGAFLAGSLGLRPDALHHAALSTGTAGTSIDRLVAAHLDFGFRLHSALSNSTPGPQNLFISPFSIALALSMAYNGTRGSTRTALARALGIGAMTTGDLNAASSAFVAHLHALDPAIALSIADSFWLRQGVTALPAFRQALHTFYAANVTALDFGDPGAPAVINAWVSRQTHGLIRSIVSRIPPRMIVYLINALYLKGPWSDPFDPRLTLPGPFMLPSGTTRTLPMMSNTGSYLHCKGPAYEAIRLPYASGKVAMYICLPAVSTGLRGFQSGLNAVTWANLLPNLKAAMGTVVLPRFTVDYGVSLNVALGTLGMGIAFDPLRADLSAMVQLHGQRAYISDVRHKTVLKVAEQGTLAAAVTSIGVGTTAMPVSAFTMTVNRPFFCAIRDETTGALLFMGMITDPRQ